MLKKIGIEMTKSLLKGTGKIVIGVAVFGLGSAVATALRPIGEREGRKLYKTVYGEEPTKTAKRTAEPKIKR